MSRVATTTRLAKRWSATPIECECPSALALVGHERIAQAIRADMRLTRDFRSGHYQAHQMVTALESGINVRHEHTATQRNDRRKDHRRENALWEL